MTREHTSQAEPLHAPKSSSSDFSTAEPGRFTPLLLLLALAFAALQLVSAWVEPYSLFHDEPYYWVGAKRLGFGYVDHPPLAPWLLAAVTALLGDGRLAFALVPALCLLATVLLTGAMAQRFGAKGFGQALAGLCVGVMPFSLVLFSFYSVNALEILLWTAATFLVVEMIRTGNDRLWLGIGVVAGIALLNKHTVALLCAGIAVGVLATPLRNQLHSRWVFIGGTVAVLFALPNLVWNAHHDWPSLAFYRSRPAADLPATVFEALELQVLGANPASIFVWVPGVLFLLFSRMARPYRPLAITFLGLFVVILLSGQRRADRIAGIYPVVLAAGATLWDRWSGRGQTAVRAVLCGVVLLAGAFVVPVTLPLIPPNAVDKYFEALGYKPEIETADVGQPIPAYLSGRLWWEPFANQVIEAWEALPPDDRLHGVVLAPHWVFASVVQYQGRNRSLPAVVAPHNAYWFWREDAVGRHVVLAVAIPAEVLSPYFSETRELSVFHCEYCTAFSRDLPLVLARGPIRPLEELLYEWRYFGIEASPHLRP